MKLTTLFEWAKKLVNTLKLNLNRTKIEIGFRIHSNCFVCSYQAIALTTALRGSRVDLVFTSVFIFEQLKRVEC